MKDTKKAVIPNRYVLMQQERDKYDIIYILIDKLFKAISGSGSDHKRINGFAAGEIYST